MKPLLSLARTGTVQNRDYLQRYTSSLNLKWVAEPSLRLR